jgi:hypothetical protein
MTRLCFVLFIGGYGQNERSGGMIVGVSSFLFTVVVFKQDCITKKLIGAVIKGIIFFI